MKINKNTDEITLNIYEFLIYSTLLLFIPFVSTSLNYLLTNKIDNPYISLIVSTITIISCIWLLINFNRNKISFPKVFTEVTNGK